MSASELFTTFVEPNLERIPVLEVSHVERHQKREYIITQTIQRNVFTDFDRKLSRHLAATRGAGFPAFTVAVRVNERGSGGSPRFLTPVHHASVPHAARARIWRPPRPKITTAPVRPEKFPIRTEKGLFQQYPPETRHSCWAF